MFLFRRCPHFRSDVTVRVIVHLLAFELVFGEASTTDLVNVSDNHGTLGWKSLRKKLTDRISCSVNDTADTGTPRK